MMHGDWLSRLATPTRLSGMAGSLPAWLAPKRRSSFSDRRKAAMVTIDAKSKVCLVSIAL